MDIPKNAELALLLTVLAGLSTGIGSTIAYFIKKLKLIYLSFLLGLSAGVMIYISFKQTQYEWLYVISAVCPKTGQPVGMLSPYISTEIMNVYLKQFAAEIFSDVHAVLIWDQAGFHKSKELVVPENITIIELPASIVRN